MKRIHNIQYPSASAQVAARERIDSLVKPPGSLGLLEDYAVKMSGIMGTVRFPALKKAIAVFAADNGVWDEGITPAPQGVTAIQAVNMTKGITGVGVLAAAAGADVFVYDAGIKGFGGHSGIIDMRLGDGTRSIAHGPAMDIGQAAKGIAHGIDAAEALFSKGYRVVGCAQMGICSSITSAAVVTVLAGAEPEEVVGHGAGIVNAQIDKEIDVVCRAIDKNRPDENNALDVLTKLGGFDIAAMTGFYLGAAYKRMAVVIDGLASAAAALVAIGLSPIAGEYMFAAHRSTEPGFSVAMDALGMDAPLSLGMRLGEGSGCPLMFHLLGSAAAMLHDMGTFAEAKIDASWLADMCSSDDSKEKQ